MKRIVIRITIAILLLALGFFAGRAFQHGRTGYQYKVHSEETHPSPLGDFQIRYVTETVGMGFLDPGTSVIEFRGRKLYSARRMFQEDSPLARNLKTSADGIEWEDGEYKYHLVISKLARKENSPDPASDTDR